nr:restriction endonuclease subunit S [Pseudomonas sp. A46]
MSELPSGWNYFSLNDLGGLSGGKTPSKANPAFWSSPDVPWVSPKDMKRNLLEDAEDRISQVAVAEASMALYPAGSVLMVTRSGILQHTFPVALAGAELTVNQDIKVLRPVEGIAPKFAFYLLKSHGGAILSACSKDGTTVQSIDSEKLEAFQFPLPPFSEQTRITKKLDELLAQVDTLKARIDGIPALLKRFRQSVLAAAVSGRLTEEWRVSLMSSEATNGLPSPEQAAVSATWFSFIHDEIADVIDPHPSHRTPSEDPNGIPYIGIGDINKLGLIDFENARKVSRSVLDEHRDRYSINDGDFIFGKIGTIGSATKVPAGGEYTISANVILVKPIREKVVPSYHFLFWCSPLALEISSKGSKATSQAAFGIKKMRKAELLYPPMAEQTEIVRRVEQLFAFADQLEAKIASAKSRIDHLTQSILTKAFRGELVPQDPNDEPASLLLERIKAQRAAAPKAKRGRKASA